MTVSQTKSGSKIIDLSAKALEVFCEDICGMFDVEMQCRWKQTASETVKGLEKRFRKIVAVNTIKAEGALKGDLHLIFDKEGLLILTGIITMKAEKEILEALGQRSIKDKNALSDAAEELGNLLTGSWDRTFGENISEHGGLSRVDGFIGKPWGKPEETIGLTGEEELGYVSYEVEIKPYPAFECGLILPQAILTGAGAISTRQKTDRQAADKTENKENQNKPQATEQTDKNSKPSVDDKDASSDGKAGSEKAQQQKAEATEQADEETQSPADDKNESSNDNDDKKTATEVEQKAEEKQPEQPKEAAQPQEENTGGTVSETIQNMTESSANLPGETAPTETGGDKQNDTADILLTTEAKDVMQHNVIWAGPQDSVQQVITAMQQNDTGYVMVGEDGELQGIVSISDVTSAVSPYLRAVFSKWHRPADDATLQIRIKWIMSRPVNTAKPDASLAVIMENMCRFGQRAMPIMDDEGKIQGLVTVFDIFKTLLDKNLDVCPIGQSLQVPPLEPAEQAK